MKLAWRLSVAAALAVCVLNQLASDYSAGQPGSSVAHAAAPKKPQCPAERQLEMDQCAARMGFLGDHSFRVPKSGAAMETFCTQLKQSISCIQNYSRDCLQGFTKQILTSLLKRGKAQYSSICQQESSRVEFRNKMACLSDDKIGQFHSCMDASVARFEFIAGGQVTAEQKLPALCCSYQIFFADTSQTLGRLCPSNNPNKPSEANQFVQKLITGTTGEFLQLICEGHRSMDECKASGVTRQLVPKLEQITRQSKAGKLQPRSKSLIPPLLEILDSSNS